MTSPVVRKKRIERDKIQMKTVIYFTISLILLVLSPLFSDIDFYVSTSGRDDWNGKYFEYTEGDNGPFATLQRAQQAVRKLKSNDELDQPVTVYIRGGVHYLDQEILFIPQDSGTEEAPIIYRGYEDEKVTLSGGKLINGWRKLSGNRWQCDVPFVREQDVTFRQLFVNGERRYRARTPDKGFYRVRDPMEKPGTPFHDYRYQFGFYPGDLISIWRNIEDVKIVFLHFWSDAHCPLQSIDPTTLTATLATPAWRRFTDDHSQRGARYFVENVYEAMDQPGEWYLDTLEGKLYYVAHENEDIPNARIIAPLLDHLLVFRGDPVEGKFVEHIHIKNITLAHTDFELPPGDPGDHFAADTVPGGVYMMGTQHVSVEQCSLTAMGTYGIEIREASQQITIINNTLVDLGGGGVMISGGRAGTDSLWKTHHIAVTDNVMTRLGRIYFASVGILSMHTFENLYAHNEISDLYYTGISAGLEWGYKPSASYKNRIEYNIIHNAGQSLLSDMGGIYTLGISTGTIVRNNIIHDIYTHGYGGWGIYTDEGSTDVTIKDNIVYNTKSGGFHQHYGKDNRVYNNIFAFGDLAQIVRSRDEDHLSYTFNQNIVYWDQGELLSGSWKGDTGNFKFDYNVYHQANNEFIDFDGLSIEQWRESGQDLHSRFADPLFVNPSQGDFDLKEDSPAFDVGYYPIDWTVAGSRHWPLEVQDIHYLSTADSSQQPALFYDSGSTEKKPLLVVLHTWSSDYRQTAGVPYLRWCKQKDWCFIHPNFRGVNKTPAATGSALVIQDILDAVDYAKSRAEIDASRIYLVGSSGGGYTALQVVAHQPDMWAAVSAWVPISDLREWYFESLARENRYADMLIASCGGAPGISDSVDAQYAARSPRHNLVHAKAVPIDLNAGIFDGHTGSVPVHHSLRAYNALAEETDQIEPELIEKMVKDAAVPDSVRYPEADPYFADRPVLFRRSSNQVRVTLFDGGHESIPFAALHWLSRHRKP